jgi:DNA-binding NarL/FixJ family response regulator
MNKLHQVKTLIIDDHPVVLNGLKGLLGNVEGLEIVDGASNGAEALLILENREIDLIISDITMPALDGIELAQLVKKKYPRIKIILLTAYNEREILKRALQSGADGCLLKEVTKKEFVEAIHKVMDNGYHYGENLFEIVQYQPNKMPDSEANELLSDRELEILKHLLNGYSNKEVAEQLHISHNTVSTHRKRIMKKADCHSISELFAFAKMNGLFPHE